MVVEATKIVLPVSNVSTINVKTLVKLLLLVDQMQYVIFKIIAQFASVHQDLKEIQDQNKVALEFHHCVPSLMNVLKTTCVSETNVIILAKTLLLVPLEKDVIIASALKFVIPTTIVYQEKSVMKEEFVYLDALQTLIA